MPKTESNFPTLSANSWLWKGMTRAKACSTSARVDSPCEEKRGRNCGRGRVALGAAGDHFLCQEQRQEKDHGPSGFPLKSTSGQETSVPVFVMRQSGSFSMAFCESSHWHGAVPSAHAFPLSATRSVYF